MRVRHRWLLVGVSVVATVTVVAILRSTRTVHDGIITSFVGYTNLHGAQLRSAVFLVTNEHPASVAFGHWHLEAEEPEDHKVHTIPGHVYFTALRTQDSKSSWLWAVDE